MTASKSNDYPRYILNETRNIPCIFEVCFLEMQTLCCKFYFMYTLREGFSAFKMNIMTEAPKLMSKDQFDKDQFDVRKGPKVKMQFKHAF